MVIGGTKKRRNSLRNVLFTWLWAPASLSTNTASGRTPHAADFAQIRPSDASLLLNYIFISSTVFTASSSSGFNYLFLLINSRKFLCASNADFSWFCCWFCRLILLFCPFNRFVGRRNYKRRGLLLVKTIRICGRMKRSRSPCKMESSSEFGRHPYWKQKPKLKNRIRFSINASEEGAIVAIVAD